MAAAPRPSTRRRAPAADMRPIGNANVTGFDLNGDGDILDTVRFYSPNNTNTRRWGATTSLIWDINDDNRLRFAYTWDRAQPSSDRRSGATSSTTARWKTCSAAARAHRVLAADGDIIRGRDRFSIAELNQFALEWRGLFAGRQAHGHRRRARALLQARAEPVLLHARWRHRQLRQHLATPAARCALRARPTATLANGNVDLPGQQPDGRCSSSRRTATTVKFDDILPNVGLSYDAHRQPAVLSIVCRRPVGAAHRQSLLGASPARRQHRPPDAGIRNHQGL